MCVCGVAGVCACVCVCVCVCVFACACNYLCLQCISLLKNSFCMDFFGHNYELFSDITYYYMYDMRCLIFGYVLKLFFFLPSKFPMGPIYCLLAECRTLDWKVVSLNPGRSSGKIFLSRVNIVCWLTQCPSPPSMLTQRHIRDPGYFAKSWGGRLHLTMHTALTKQSRRGLIMLLSRHSVGTYLERSSHATCQGTFSHSCLSSLSHCGLILV